MKDKDKKEESRQFVLPLSELIDRLTINHIKLVKTNVENSGYIDEINKKLKRFRNLKSYTRQLDNLDSGKKLYPCGSV